MLTKGQRAVLEVLAVTGDWTPAHKRASTTEPIPRVNAVAASSLARLRPRLVDVDIIPWASNFVSPYRYRINDEGRRALG